MSLRSGSSIDSYGEPLPFDAALDSLTDEYLERNHWGLPHLDAESWRFYLPHLIDYAVRHRTDKDSAAISALVQTLRPPDRDPPRLASLSSSQAEINVALLEVLGFSDDSKFQGEALQALEEYWIPGALYRPEMGTDPPRERDE